MVDLSSLEQGIYDAARLRGLAFFNEYDVSFKEYRHREIRYFVDPAVALLLFIWPGRLRTSERHNASYLSTFSHSSGSLDAEVVDGLLTGECLFVQSINSANLDRDGVRFGQREMLPSHWSEFVRVINNFLSREIGDDPKVLTEEFSVALDAAQKDLEGVNDELRATSAESTSALRTRSRVMSKAAAQLEATKIMQLAMQRRMRQNSLVLPATRLPQQAFRPGQNEVMAWETALRDAGKTVSVRPDAKVLAQIDMLNALEAKKPLRERVLNVLVTGDQAIHKAVFSRRLSEAAESQRAGEFIGKKFVPDWEHEIFSEFMETYTVRHPAQFVATLNQQQMRNKIETTKLFEKVVTGTEAILANITGSQAEVMDLAAKAVRSPDDAIEDIREGIKRASHFDLAEIVENFDAVEQNWERSMQLSVVINRGSIINRMRAARRVTEEVLLGDGALERMLETEQLALWNSVTQIGLSNAAREALGQMRDALTERGRDDESAPPRMPAHLIFDYALIIGEQRLYSVQEGLERGDQSTFDMLDDRIVNLDTAQIWRAFLLCAVFAARASDWSRLIWYAGKTIEALNIHDKDTWGDVEREGYYEALYTASIGRRLRQFEPDYAEANEFLKEAIAYHDRSKPDDHEEQLRLARALSEHGTLRLFEQFRQLKSENLEAVLPAQEITEARENLKRAAEIARDQEKRLFDDGAWGTFKPRRKNQLRRLYGHVFRQSKLNLPFFDLLGHFVFPEDEAFPDHFSGGEFHAMVEDAARAWPLLEYSSSQNRKMGVAEEARDASDIPDGEPELDDEGEDNAPLDNAFFKLDLSVLSVADASEDPNELRALRQEVVQHYDALPLRQATAVDKLFADVLFEWAKAWIDHRLGSEKI